MGGGGGGQSPGQLDEVSLPLQTLSPQKAEGGGGGQSPGHEDEVSPSPDSQVAFPQTGPDGGGGGGGGEVTQAVPSQYCPDGQVVVVVEVTQEVPFQY
mgnify:FL=1